MHLIRILDVFFGCIAFKYYICVWLCRKHRKIRFVTRLFPSKRNQLHLKCTHIPFEYKQNRINNFAKKRIVINSEQMLHHKPMTAFEHCTNFEANGQKLHSYPCVKLPLQTITILNKYKQHEMRVPNIICSRLYGNRLKTTNTLTMMGENRPYNFELYRLKRRDIVQKESSRFHFR